MLFLQILAILPLFSLALEIPPEVQQLIDAVHGACTQKIGVTDDDVKNYVISDNSQKMMCYMNCLMLESGWMAPDGNIRFDHIIDNTHENIKHILLPALDKCRDINPGTQECEKAYNFNVCLQKADPKHYFLP